MRTFVILFTVLMIGLSIVPATASANAMYPFMLRYWNCTDTGPATQSAVREHCAAERARLMTEAEPFLKSFFPFDRLEAKRQFEMSFVYAERSAEWGAKHGERFQPIELRYISCLADQAFEDEQYRAGKYLNGGPIVKKCRPLYDEARASFGNDSVGKKAKLRLWRVKDTFARLRVFPISSSDPRETFTQ